MRILFLAEAVSPHIGRWQQEFDKLGWETLLASCDYDANFTGRKLTTKATSGPWRYLSLVEQVRAMVQDFNPHLVNAHFLPSYGLAAAVAKVHPLALTLWGSDVLISGDRGFLSRMRSRFVLKRADLVVGDSQSLLERAAAIRPLARRLVVSFGVRRSWYESGRDRVLSDVDRINILSTRSLERLYDVGTLLRAAKKLRDERFPFHLKIVGYGKQESELRTLASELGLQESAEFVGRLSNEVMFSAYRNADIYVSTSRSDSTSVSLLEAMSQKLYPVVTDIPGNREWLESDAHFFGVGDHDALADRIKAGFDRAARAEAYEAYEPTLRQKGIREEQMKAAHLTFLKLIEEYERR